MNDYAKAVKAAQASKAHEGGVAMSIRMIFGLALLWALSLFAVSSLATAQVFEIRPLSEPRIISGADFGFRVEGEQGGVPVGRMVVRIDGKWVEVTSLPGTQRITSR